jgi:hypothetical protein
MKPTTQLKPTTQPPDARGAKAQPPETLVGLRKREPKHVAAGIPAIYHAMQQG